MRCDPSWCILAFYPRSFDCSFPFDCLNIEDKIVSLRYFDKNALLRCVFPSVLDSRNAFVGERDKRRCPDRRKRKRRCRLCFISARSSSIYIRRPLLSMASLALTRVFKSSFHPRSKATASVAATTTAAAVDCDAHSDTKKKKGVEQQQSPPQSVCNLRSSKRHRFDCENDVCLVVALNKYCVVSSLFSTTISSF